MAADPSLGVSAQPLLIPAVPKSDAPGFGGAAPEHWLFTFGDKTQTDLLSPLDPQLRIFPAGAFAAIDPTMAKVIEDLKALLAARPAEITGTIPVLPLIPAAQVLHAQPRYLDFQNGSGVSFVTAYAQDVSPILRDRTFYTFQGLTKDGQYYISLFYPVTTGVLPQTVEETPAAKDMDAFVKGFDQYLADTTALLSDPATAYEPDLVILDNLMTSLNVAPPAPPAPPASAQAAPTPVPRRTGGSELDGDDDGRGQRALGARHAQPDHRHPSPRRASGSRRPQRGRQLDPGEAERRRAGLDQRNLPALGSGVG